MEIENWDLEELLDTLKPYQRNTMKQLVDQFGVETAIEKWITARGPTNIRRFGGTEESKPFLDRFRAEVDKFLCGHPDYQESRDQLSKHSTVPKELVISAMSSAIGATLGLAATLLAPAIVLTLFTVGKIGLNAYCADKSKTV